MTTSTCPCCQLSTNPETQGAYSIKCDKCIARSYVDRITILFGDRAKGIKDAMFEILAREDR